MHYCFLIFTKERPNENVLENIMKPYNSESFYDSEESEYPEFTWDYYLVGGRYDSKLKFDFNKHYEDQSEMDFSRQTRNHIAFDSSILDKIKDNYSSKYGYDKFDEVDYFGAMGYDDGFIRVDGCKIKDLHDTQDKNIGFGFIGIDGFAYSREWYSGNQENPFVKRLDYEEKLFEAWDKAEKEDGYVTVIDIHD